MLEKAATMKRFEYSLLGEELKKQTSVAQKQRQNFDNAFITNKDNKNVTMLTKKLVAVLLNQNIHIYQVFMIICKN